jgi:tryptophan synthase beta chain
LKAFSLLSEYEGILPALESAHALAALEKLPIDESGRRIIGLCLSGRGDKDLATVIAAHDTNNNGTTGKR